MDIAKYLSLLTTRRLWFTRVAEFRKTDPYEGAFTSRDEAMIQEILEATSNNELINIFRKHGDEQSAWFIEQVSRSVAYHQVRFAATRFNIEHESYTNCVSCWHANPGESDAMWALYAQRDAGIAIKTTVENIQRAFEKSDRQIAVARVNYDSEDKPASAIAWAALVPVLIKRHAFHHENEVRIILDAMEGYEAPDHSEGNKRYIIDPGRRVPPGVGVECDLDALLGEIVLSPLMQPHLRDAIIAVTKLLLPNHISGPSGMLKTAPDGRMSEDFMRLWDNYRKTKRLLDFGGIEAERVQSPSGKNF